MAIREQVFTDNFHHPDRIDSARWVAIAILALADLGDPEADPALAEEICGKYSISAEDLKTSVAEIVTRARAFEIEGTEPPGFSEIG